MAQKPGDTVKKMRPCWKHTDKVVDSEVPSTVAGTITALLYVNDVVPVER